MPQQFHNHKVTLFSGALSRDIDGKIRRSVHLPKTCVMEITDLCFRHKSPFIMDNITHYYHPPITGFTFGFIDSQVANYQITDFEQMLTTDIYKILVFDMQLHDMFTAYAGENDLVVKHHSYDNCFDLVVNGCNKYDGVLPLLENFAPSDIFVFGNDFNDYEMLCHFPNSIVFGSIDQLLQVAKLSIKYDKHQEDKFRLIVDTILHS
jgi:hydroxymethylpyrimidine pyrophosphatase-like HAD family hydrolase